jgi:AcrR family transcriptional regulator
VSEQAVRPRVGASGGEHPGRGPHTALTGKGRGRPRDERADEAILAAALELLAEVGPTGLSVEEVATRAGVGKATIYRRFAGKDELVLAALQALNEHLPAVPPDGSARDALVAVVTGWWDRHGSSSAGQVFPRVFAHARTNPTMFGCFYDSVIEQRRDLYRAIIRRGVSSGELRADTDVELLTTLVISSTLYLLQVRSAGRDAAPGAGPAEVVDAILAGFLPR